MIKSSQVFFTSLFLLLSFTFFGQDSTWIEQEVPFENGTLADLVFIDQNKGWTVGQDFNDGTMVILHTEDAGETWIRQVVPDLNAYLAKIVMIDEERGFSLGTQYDDAVGLYTHDGGENWKLQSFPDDCLFIDALAFSNDSTGWAGGSGENRAFILEMENDSTWKERFSIDTEGFFASIVFVDDQYGWAAGSDWTTTFGEPLLAMTPDGGKNWELVDLPVTTGFLSDVTFVNRDTGWLVGSSENDFLILETMDRGESWTKIDSVDQNLFKDDMASFSRDEGFNKITQFEIRLQQKLRFGLEILEKYDNRNTGKITIVTLIVFTALFFKLNIGTFLAPFILSFFMHAYALIQDQIPLNEEGPRSEQKLNPADLVCYAFGSEQGENWSSRPVIFKKEIKHSFLNAISVEPKDIEIVEGDSVELFVYGTDQYGDEMVVEKPLWMVDGGGTLVEDEQGIWFFGEEAGEYTITCTDQYTGHSDQASLFIDEGVGLAEFQGSNTNLFNLAISPNPANTVLDIALRLPYPGRVDLKIYDEYGKKVYSLSQNLESGDEQIDCDISKWTPGKYYCQLGFNNKRIIKAFVVVN